MVARDAIHLVYCVRERLVCCREALVFMIGGGNYLERETLAAWASRSQPPRQVRAVGMRGSSKRSNQSAVMAQPATLLADGYCAYSCQCWMLVGTYGREQV